MTTPRLVQNFRGFRAHLVLSDRRQVENLEASLTRLGLTIGYVDPRAGGGALDCASLAQDRDVLFIDGDLERPPFSVPDQAQAFHHAPVIGLVGVEAPSRLKSLLSLGATAFLRKPVHGSTVYSALFMGINGFLRRRQLEITVEEHEQRRRGRRFVIKAVIILAQKTGMDDDQAYSALRRESMKQRISMEDYCERFTRHQLDGIRAPGDLPPVGRTALHK